MRTLKKIISRYIQFITCTLVILILTTIVYIQVKSEQRQAFESADRSFCQIEQLLEENQKELEDIREEYSLTCLHNAEAIAYIIENNPGVLENIEELKRIARFMEVDEIHIFDRTGRIFAGTHPEYYDYTFDSGEQMMFFKPMLEDKSLKLVQDITPNTAEAKMMQYSALWSKSGEFIVQVGMEPVNVMKVTQKNELSYLFSFFRVNMDANYYAVDIDSGKIVGSTDPECVGKNLGELGLSLKDMTGHEKGFHALVNGQNSYCVFKIAGSNYIGRVISSRELYKRIPSTAAMLALCLIAIAMILARAVTRYINRYVVDGIHQINEKLHMIAGGNLDEMVDIQSNVEFSQLSSYINRMKESLLDNNRKMSYVLSKTNMYIGVYEYNEQMKRVRFTEYVPRLLSLDEAGKEELASDYKAFRECIRALRENPLEDESNVYLLDGHYIKLEEARENQGVFGVIIDVTEEIEKRRKIEAERDLDLLTGLLNRRGLDARLTALFHEPGKLEAGALIVIDADNLKGINDTYGHEAGDVYLKELSRYIKEFGNRESVAFRTGGDEFVLFLYRYESKKELVDMIETLEDLQNHSQICLDGKIKVPLRFSYGYSLVYEDKDYHELMKEADAKMYENKRKRKKADVQAF